ncbi:MAG: hypothetical protein V4717_08505 [Bacteroidota bacterium]
MKCIYLSIPLLFLFFACKDQNPATTLASDNDTSNVASKESLYPYPQYIQAQINRLDSVQLGIEKVVYENGVKKDSGFISREEFRQIATAFMVPDLNETKWRNEYEETSFRDLSLNTITFTIAAKNEKLPVQKADVLLNPDTQEVKYVMIKKEEKKDGYFESSNLMWVNNMNFQIVTSRTGTDGKELKKLVKVTWDKPISNL